MTKIEEHADHLLNAAADLRIAVKAKRYDEARQHAASVSKHRSVIIAIIEAVEELQPSPQPIQRKMREGIKRPGHLTRYIESFLFQMKDGDMRLIPATEEFPIEQLRNSVSSCAARVWGKQKYITQRRDDGVMVMKG